jgi:hypothetical protein
MGRHSAASDDEGDELSAAQTAVALDDRPTGRHAAPPRPPAPVAAPASVALAKPGGAKPTDAAKADTERIPLITDPIVDRPIPESETVQIPVITAALLDDLAPPPTGEPVLDEPVLDQPVVDEPVVDEPAVPSAPVVAPSSAPKASGHSTAADIALIRGHGDVRARAIAAVLVPFVVYVVYWLIVGHATTRSWLIWIWIPVIAAGVLFGLTLDLGHKRYGTLDAPSAGR